MPELFDYQQRAKDLAYDSFNQGNRYPLLQIPTGGGKTFIAASMITDAMERKKRSLFTVPYLSLLQQTVDAFVDFGIPREEIGVIQGDQKTHYLRRVQVASLQTLFRRKDNLPLTDFVINDERHINFTFYQEWFKQWSAVKFLGLSATPWTPGLGEVCDDLIQPVTIAELIWRERLAPFRWFDCEIPDLTFVRRTKNKAGEEDYHEGELSAVMQSRRYIGNVIENYKKQGYMQPAITYAVDRAHGKVLTEEFNANGIPTAYIDMNTTREERERIFRDFQQRRYINMVNVYTLVAGLDVNVTICIDCAPTLSESRFVQKIGRVLRYKPGKIAMVFDHAGNRAELGMPTEIYHPWFTPAKGKATPAELSREDPDYTCKSCSFLRPPATPQCPACGFQAKPQTDVVELDGELTEVPATMAAERRHKKDSIETKQDMFSQLIKYALDKGWSEGWASHTYREYYGAWPSNKLKREPSRTIGEKANNFIKSLMIKNRKKQDKHQKNLRKQKRQSMI